MIARVATVVVLIVTAVGVASAQPIGTFRWQLTPYCNVITLNVVQAGAIYQLDGTDDQCGASQKGSIVGLAFLNPDGSIGFGLTNVTPTGTAVHIEVALSVATLGGSWRDSAGNSGTLVFTPGAGSGGPPRPVPPGGIPAGTVTAAQIAPGAVGAAQLAPGSVGAPQIAPGSVTTAALQAPAKVAFASGDQGIVLWTFGYPFDTAAIVRTATLTAPTSGQVIVNASGHVVTNGAGGTRDEGSCSITTGTSIDGTHEIRFGEFAGYEVASMPFAGVRTFDVAAGPFTVNLFCQASSGVFQVADTSLTALFIPQ